MKKTLSILLALVLMLSLLAGCGGQSSTETPNQGGEQPSQGNEQPQEQTFEKIFRYSATSDPSNINPFNNDTSILDYVNARLYRYVPDDSAGGELTRTKTEPDMAAKEPYTKPGDDYTWYIELRDDLKWSNGEPINADTFLYSWKMGLDPKIVYGNCVNIARNFCEIENAYEYYTQESTGVKVDWEDVGFKKADDLTIAVKMTQRYTPLEVMQQFQMRYTGPIYQPLYDASFNADHSENTYGNSKDNFMGCGMFTLDSWTQGAERVLSKNPLYCHADEIKLDGIYVRVVADDATALELFKAGEVDYLSLGTSSYDVYAEDPRTIALPNSNVRGIEINITHPTKTYLGNNNFKKALYYATNREALASLTHSMAAPYFLPTTYIVPSTGQSLRERPEFQEYLPANNGFDPELAKQLFKKAQEETGFTKATLEIMYNESISNLRLIAEYLQSSWTEIFGSDVIEVKPLAMQFSQATTLMRASREAPTDKWDLCIGSWNLTAAAFYANRKFERYTSTNQSRFCYYANDVIDKYYPLSVSEEYRLDESKWLEAVRLMDKSVIDDVTQLTLVQDMAYHIFTDRCIRPCKTSITNEGFCFHHFDLSAPAN